MGQPSFSRLAHVLEDEAGSVAAGSEQPDPEPRGSPRGRLAPVLDAVPLALNEPGARQVTQCERLLELFRAACSARQCDLLRLGVENPCVQFGPAVVSVDSAGVYVLLLAVIVDPFGTHRARDGLLVGDGPPHLTVGKVAEGGGWVRELHSTHVIWEIAGAPSRVPGLETLAWSHETVQILDFSQFLPHLNEDVDLFGAAARGPVPAEVIFEDHRFLLVGGEALGVYRRVQARLAGHLRTSIGRRGYP
jgi:hypothetical protein